MTSPDRRSWSWLALGAAALLLPVSNGRYCVPLAPWAAMFLLLYFVRGRRARVGIPVAWLTLSLAATFQFRGMAPVPGVFYFLLWATYGLAMVIPFWIDRLVAPRIGRLAGTLVLPTAWVVMEWLVASFTPYGSWNSLAYSQHENLVLLQLVAVTGLYGPSFLIMWFAATGCLIATRGLGDRKARRAALVFTLCLGIVLMSGGLRLTLFRPEAPTVRVASLSGKTGTLFAGIGGGARAAMRGELTGGEVARLRLNADGILTDLLFRAEREVQAGADIVFWGETNSFCLKQDEPAANRRVAALAREHHVYVGASPAVFDSAKEKPLENKIVLFDPRGEVAFEAWKAIPVPGPDAAVQARDDGILKTVDTPFGRVGAVICFDMDFPNLLKQAGRQDVDIMLVPANDWRAIDPWHSHMARFRAVEQGFNMVRHVSSGLSIAVDYQGRVLASMDHYVTGNRDLVSQVPTRGVRTVYARIGDVFAWGCVAGLAILVGGAWRRRRAGREPD
jgi:apolipoprotein N-acyltransferase